MNIIPTDESGQSLDEGPDSYEELIGQLINFRVEIHEARNLPQTHSNNVYCEFHFPGLGIRRTSIVPGFSEQPVFNWKEQFNSVLVDETLARYMQTNKLAVCLYGTGMAMRIETPKKVFNRSKNEFTAAIAGCAETEMENRAKKQNDAKTKASANEGLKKEFVISSDKQDNPNLPSMNGRNADSNQKKSEYSNKTGIIVDPRTKINEEKNKSASNPNENHKKKSSKDSDKKNNDKLESGGKKKDCIVF